MKKYLAIILALAMVFSLAACGGSGSSGSTDTGSSSGSSAGSASSGGSDSGAATDSGSSSAAAPAGLPSKGDFAAGPEWTIDTAPTRDNGSWAQSYAVIDALAEQAKAYDGVAAERTFSLACHDPAESAPGEFLTAWANAVTIATEGRVDFNIGYSGTLSSTMASLDDMKNGTIDFDWTLPCYFKGYMPLTNVIQNPGLGIKNGTVGSYTMWDLYKNNEALQKEYEDDGELLFVWTNCTSPLSYKGSAEIDSTGTITGNIRANNGPAQTFVTEVGGSVFGCPIGDVYSNVQNGIINYLVTDWHGIKSFQLYESGVLNYYVDTNIGCSAYVLMANSDIWGSIDADLQDAIKSVSGDYLLNMVDIWNYWEASGRYDAVSAGGIIFTPSDAFAAELQTAYDNVAATWVSEQSDTALAQDLYDQAKALVEKYNSEFESGGLSSSSSSAASTGASGDTASAAGPDGLPVKNGTGPSWDVSTAPTHDNGPWAQSYAVIDALAEQAKAYDGVAAQRTFSLACHDPAESAPGEFLTAWANAVTIATEGAIDFNIGYSGTLSSTMASLDDMKNGTIDFDWTLPCYFKGYMPLTNVIQNPGLGIKNGTVGSYVMWDLYKNNEALQKEYEDDGELLFVWTNCTSPLSYKGSAEIDSTGVITGNIRANNGPAQTFVTEVGGSVFGCPIGDVYSNVQNGIINYLVTDWHGIKSFQLYESGVLNYYVDTNIGCSAYVLMANSDIWDSIDPDLQEAIKSVSGDYLLNLVDIWSYWEASGRYDAVSAGGTIFEPSDAFAAELQAAYDNVAATWVSEQSDSGLAQDLYDQAKTLVDKYNTQFDW